MIAAWYERHRHVGDSVRREDVEAAIALLNRYAEAAGTKSGREKRLKEIIAQLSTGD